MHNKMNVLFNYPYRPQYYLTHPHIFFRHLKYNIRDAWQRITRGYCDSDVFNMDYWFLDIMPPMLRQIAQSEAYIILGEDGTREDWCNWLYDLAQRMERCHPNNTDDRNEFAAEYNSGERVPNELIDKYLDRENEILAENSEEIKRILNDMGEHFFALWI